MSKAKILIVEDEAIIAADLAGKLRRLDYEISGTASEGKDAVVMARDLKPDVVLMDIRLEEPMDGIYAAEAIRREHDVPVIYLTAHSDPATLERAKTTGPFGYILKPFEERELTTQIELALYKHNIDRQVRQERDILQAVMNGAKNSHLVFLDRDFNFVRVNETYAKTCGYTPEQMIGLNHFALYPHAENQEIFTRVRDTRIAAEFHDKPFVFPDQPERGTTYWDWTLIPIQAGSGRVNGLVFSLFETTERKRAEEGLQQANERLQEQAEELQAQAEELTTANEELRKREELLWVRSQELDKSRREAEDERNRLEAVLDALPVGTAILDSKGGNVRSNRAFEEVWRGPLPITSSVSDYKHYKAWWVDTGKIVAPGEWASALALRKGESVFGQVMEIQRFDGSHGFVINSAAPIRDSSQSIVGSAVAIQDITELHRAKQALQESEQKFRSMFANAAIGFFLTTPEGRFVDANPAYCAISGYTIGELQALESPDLIHPDDLEENMALTNQMLAGRIADFVVENRYFRKNGTIAWVRKSVSLVRNTEGMPQWLIALVEDVTERKEAEQALQKRTAELEAANKEMEAFSYSVSHDLRAPLRTIDGFSHIILEDYAQFLDETGMNYFNRVREGAQKMGELIDAMLSLSRLHRSNLVRTEVNLGSLALEIAAELKNANPGRQVEFFIAENVTARADTAMMRAVLDNLFRNAWKFTAKHEKARIEFGVKAVDKETVYFVRDDGAGFNMNYADKLFKAFQRLHRSDEFAGMGIGLATVQRIINRHGGRIWAEAEVEKGATFYFTLGACWT